MAMMRRLPAVALSTITRRSGLSASSPFSLAGSQARRAASTDQMAEANAQLMSLQEVSTAADLAARGRLSEAAPLLQRAVEICDGSMGKDSALARAAVHRLAAVLYDDERFSAAEAALTRGTSGAGKSFPVGAAELLLLSKAQLFQGKTSDAVEACSLAVNLCQQHDYNTPDTEALGQALRQLGAVQMLDGAEDDAETSLLRAARLGSTPADQGKGLAALAAFNTARGDEQSTEEAVDLWNEACATTKDEAGDEPSPAGQGEGGREMEDGALDVGKGSPTIRLARASVLCNSAQGELILERGTVTASERLAEALKIREELLPCDHPATAWTLGLLARCHLVAGEAVTAEGLYRAALDCFDGIGEASGTPPPPATAATGAAVTSGFYPSPIHPYSKEATLRGYTKLLSQWEKREAEAEQALRRADLVEASLFLKPPGGLTMHMLHLDDVY